jgi:predicted RNA-binding Zn-ribbon protein involved in translation (DUF1610 family)
MNNNDDVLTLSRQEQQEQQQEQQQQQQQPKKTTEKTNHQSQSIKKKSSKYPSKVTKQRTLPKSSQKQSSTKPRCTRCGLTQLIDITHHEFPKQKGLVFECASCGNNSIRSNVSPNERKRRLAKVAADHLNIIECHFCKKIFHSHDDYLIHLKDDHESNK